MSICNQCGVDLGEGNEKCPLCEPEGLNSGHSVSPADLFSFSRKENTRHFYEICILLLISGIVITLSIDAVFGKGMSWSLITASCIAYLLATITSVYFLIRRPYITIALTTAATLIFLWTLHLLAGNNGWFASLAAPLTATAGLLAGAVILLSSLSKYRGLNQVAIILLATALFSLVTEFLTDRYLVGEYTPQWSVVTASSLALVSMIFIFIHYRLKKGRNFGSLFHI